MPPERWASACALRGELLVAERLTLGDYREIDARAVHFVAAPGPADGGEGGPSRDDRVAAPRVPVEDDGALPVVGYAQYDPRHNRLRQMVVAEASRGRGIGRALVAAIAREARQSRRTELTVHAWERTRGFYARVGFRPIGEPTDVASEGGGVVVSWLPMALDLEADEGSR